MITDLNTISEAILCQKDHPVIQAFQKWKNAQNQLPTEHELKNLLKLIGQSELIDGFDFFMRVFWHRNEQVYCYLDSIQGKLNWYVNYGSQNSLIREEIASVESHIIIERFEALGMRLK